MKGLREEVESEGDITRMLAPFPVLLAEVCETLGLCLEERDEVLGPAAAFVQRRVENAQGATSLASD